MIVNSDILEIIVVNPFWRESLGGDPLDNCLTTIGTGAADMKLKWVGAPGRMTNGRIAIASGHCRD
jgi:hypothetical protein